MPQTIVVLDFGSQYTQVIARRIREANVFSSVLPYNSKLSDIREQNPVGIVLSGGPASVFAKDSPKPNWYVQTGGAHSWYLLWFTIDE